jgi:hypothetical protein
MLDVLMSLPETDPKFFDELSKDPRKTPAYNPRCSRAVPESVLSAAQQDAHEELPFYMVDDDDENIPTTDIIDHLVSGGEHSVDYIEQDGCLVTASFQAERSEDISSKEMEEADDLDNNSSGSETGSRSGSNFDFSGNV